MNMLNLSIAVTAAAALVLLFKLLFGNKITPRGHMLLWLLPAVAMLAVPLAGILPESDFAVRTYLPQAQARIGTSSAWTGQADYLSETADERQQADGQMVDTQGVNGQAHVSMQVPFTDRTLTGDFAASRHPQPCEDRDQARRGHNVSDAAGRSVCDRVGKRIQRGRAAAGTGA